MTLEDIIALVPADHRWVLRKVSPLELLYQHGAYFANILGPKFGDMPRPDDSVGDHATYKGHGATPADALQAAIDSHNKEANQWT
jgi:hypothetical protein